MRQAQPEEYGCAVPVKVTLAGEDEKILKQNMRGTILIQEEHKVQPIVPLGALIEELGYSLHWTPTKLKLSHPEKGSVRVRVNNHCPEVAACEALSMIKELEMKQVAELNNNVNTLKARLEMIRKEEQREWPELLKAYTSTGSRSSLLKALMKCPFTKDLPAEVRSLMLEEFEPTKGEVYLKALPLTRRMRRLMMSSRKWVVDLNVGKAEEKEDPFSVISRNGKVLVEVNYEKSKLRDLHKRGAVYQMLLWAASSGRISDVIGCPANDTWVNEATPEELRAATPKRTDEEPFGLKDMPPLQKPATGP